MKSIYTLMLAVIISTSIATGPAFAGDTDPLFVNLTTDDTHRANMAMNFGQNQLKRDTL